MEPESLSLNVAKYDTNTSGRIYRHEVATTVKEKWLAGEIGSELYSTVLEYCTGCQQLPQPQLPESQQLESARDPQAPQQPLESEQPRPDVDCSAVCAATRACLASDRSRKGLAAVMRRHPGREVSAAAARSRSERPLSPGAPACAGPGNRGRIPACARVFAAWLHACPALIE